MNQAIRRRIVGASVVAAVLGAAVAQPASARDSIFQPKPGSAQRKAIFNALRVPVGRSVGKKVIFQGNLNASKSGWAFFSGGALIDDGKNGKTIWDGGSNGEMVALLRQTKGKWRVMSWGFGGGMDATYEAMNKYPSAPRALFRFEG